MEEIKTQQPFFKRTFSSFKIKNYRRYYIGQLISYCGNFLQAIAQDWLVLQMTGSGTLLGLVLLFQFLPLLLLSSYGGVIADRFRKLNILYFTQIAFAILALGLGALVLTNSVRLWMVFAFALIWGLVTALDNPARQTFIYEMVGKENIKNAVSLWAVLISLTRIIGPAIAGVLILIFGIGWCFIINALTYVAAIISFLMIRVKELHLTELVKKEKGQLKEGFKYVLATPVLFNALLSMAIIGTITYEWSASLPLFAKFVLNGNAGTYSFLMVVMSIGMIFGGVYSASSHKSSLRRMNFFALLFGVCILIASFLTNYILLVVMLAFVGFFSLLYANMTNSILQINSDPKFRGRVIALWSAAFFGSTAVGGPLIGWIGEMFGARWALATGGLAAIFAAIICYIIMKEEKVKDTPVDELKGKR